jgi:hypothetical protein
MANTGVRSKPKLDQWVLEIQHKEGRNAFQFLQAYFFVVYKQLGGMLTSKTQGRNQIINWMVLEKI